MINMPTTDILTPITGEVEKPITTDRGETAEVSFQSIVAVEDTDTAALITVSDQLLVPQTLRNPHTDHVGLAAAFPVFVTVPDPVLPPQGGHLSTPNQFKSPPPSILLTAVTDEDRGDAQSALIGDVRQIVPAAPPYSKETPGNELGAAPRSIIDVPDQAMFPNEATDVSAIRIEEAVNVLRPVAAELPLFGGNLTRLPANGSPVLAQYNSEGLTVEAKVYSAAPATKNTPIATPTNAVLPGTALPKMPAGSSEGLLPLVDSPKMSAATQEKPGFIQQIPNAPQAQSKLIDPMNIWSRFPSTEPVDGRAIASKSVPAPVQGSALRSIQAPTVDLPVNHADSGTAIHDPKAALKTDVAQPDRARPSATPQLQTPPEVAARPEMPLKEIQPPAQGLQNQAKQPPLQSTEAAPMQPVQALATQLQPAVLTPQANPSPTAEKHTVKLNSQPEPVSQIRAPSSRVSSKSYNTQTAPLSGVVPTVPMTENTMAETLEPLSTPELMPFDARSTDITSVLRHDATINRPEVMRHVAQQLVEVARQMPDRPVELALNPEELGRVRLTFTTTDGGIHIAVMAERGETMDLLRRHIETLAQEFREMGYKDVNFKFSQNGQNDAQNDDADAQSGADPDAAPEQTQTLAPVQLSLEPSAGLDLRL